MEILQEDWCEIYDILNEKIRRLYYMLNNGAVTFDTAQFIQEEIIRLEILVNKISTII